MEAFTYRHGILHAEDLPLTELAERYGTPLYVYSRGYMRARYRTLCDALRPLEPLLHYAVKANSNAAVIRLFAREGAGADIVSGGELQRAVRAGIDPAQVVFSGVGKTVGEIDAALEAGIRFFAVESEPELERIAERAGGLGRCAPVAVRVNPDVDPRTHRYTSTGRKESKFGVDLERARRMYDRIAELPAVEAVGLHMHLGSPISGADPYVSALDKVAGLCAELRKRHAAFRYLDLGGGMGIPYREDEPDFDMPAFAAAILPGVRATGLRLCLEPGRYLTGNGGVLLCRVQYVKENAFKQFIVVDAAMNDLVRPALYEAYHAVRPVRTADGSVLADLVGPVCEGSDFFALERTLPRVAGGDLLAIMSAGAYGFSMASTYNSRPRAAEVMVSGPRAEEVRARETGDDLARGERLPDW